MVTRSRNRGAQEARLRVSVNNPFTHIPFARGDLNASPVTGGGGKELVPIDQAYREALVATLDETQRVLAGDLALYPTSLGPLVLKLRDIGVAKSHRPLKLVEAAGIQPAGHSNVDEMLVGAQAVSLANLRAVILTRNIKQIRNNLSAILRIEPWSRARRNPEGSEALRQRGTALLRLFRYFSDDATQHNVDTLRALLVRLQIPFSEISQRRGLPLFRVLDMDGASEERLESLLSYPGLRHIHAEPRYSSGVIGQVGAGNGGAAPSPLAAPAADLPIVGVFDTGISNAAASVGGYVAGRHVFVLPPDTNYEHGTMVASLIAGAGVLNPGHAWFPGVSCQVFDACGLETAGSDVSILIERLKEVVPTRPDIKVWNLSLGAGQCDSNSFSEFAQALDDLSDQYGVLFVVASGNYTAMPRRGWPDATPLPDRVSSPGDSVRALTVGSIAHLDAPGAWVGAGGPAPYSRCGPGPVFTPKPDIVHVGGGVHNPWNVGAASVNVIEPRDTVTQTFGTSFAAPIAAGMAAHTWRALEGRDGLAPHPSIVKALLIHAAQLSSPDYTASERRYFGAGRPDDVLETLYDSDDSFTLAFQALVFPNSRWRKSPYPIPAALLHNGKFRGEVIITAVYAPPLDGDGGSEYVRANVDVSFGVLNGDRISGRVPMENEVGQTGYEALQVEHGAKWAPVKIYRKRFPEGAGGDVWALQAGVTLRAYEPPLTAPLPVTILVTLRSLEADPAVHADGLRALAVTNWIRESLPVRVPVQN